MKGKGTNGKRRNFSATDFAEVLEKIGGVGYMKGKAAETPRAISTGVDVIDALTGIWGLPEGRVIVSHGPASSGKSTLLYQCMASVQQQGGVAILFDWEKKMPPAYARALGVDTRQLIVPVGLDDKGKPIENEILFVEEGFEKLDKLARAAREHFPHIPILFGWDSMQAVSSMNEKDRGYAETGFLGESAAYSRCLRKLAPTLANTRSILMFVSQVRADIGNPIPNQQKVGVGNAGNHAATIIFKWRVVGPVGTTKREGSRVEVITIKNQVGAEGPFQKAEFPVLSGIGIDPAGSLLAAAEMCGFAKKEKAGYYSLDWGNEPKRVRVGDLRNMKENKPEAFQAMRDFVRERSLGIGKASKVEAPVEVEEEIPGGG